MITITEKNRRAIAVVARQILMGAPSVTIRQDTAPGLYEDAIDRLPYDELFEQAAAVVAAASPAAADPDPEPKPADPMIPKWIAEGEAAYRIGTPRTNSPGGRKDRHWLAGWDRAKALDCAPKPEPDQTIGAVDEPLPPARTPEVDIDEQEAA